MAIKDMKNMFLAVVDGSGYTPGNATAASTTASALAGATSVAVTMTGAFAAGDAVTFAGVSGSYVVTAALAAPGTLTFSPGLAGAVASSAAVTRTNGTSAPPSIDPATGAVIFGSGKTCLVKVGTGNVTWDEKAAREYILNQGLLDKVRNGNQAPVDVNFEGQYEFYLNNDYGGNWSPGGTGTGIGLLEIVKGTYGMSRVDAIASSFTSTDPDGCQPYACDLYVIDSPFCNPSAAGSTEVLRFAKFRHESVKGDWKTGMFTISGKCNILFPTAVRS